MIPQATATKFVPCYLRFRIRPAIERIVRAIGPSDVSDDGTEAEEGRLLDVPGFVFEDGPAAGGDDTSGPPPEPPPDDDWSDFEPHDELFEQVKAALAADGEKRSRSWTRSLLILLVTMIVFVQLGILRWGLADLVLILGVLIVHELGHLAAMKLFGYADVRMFFIPLLGAAVSGRQQGTAGWKKAIVTLAGPLPGIALSILLFIVAIIRPETWLLYTASAFLLINAFNLLPVLPLDGGRLIHEVIFSRRPGLDVAMGVFSALAFLIAGFALGNWFLKILGFFNLFFVPAKRAHAKVTRRLRDHLCQAPPEQAQDIEAQTTIPDPILRRLIDWIQQDISPKFKPTSLARTAQEIWDRVRLRPPRIPAAIVLLGLYGGGWIMTFIGVVFGFGAVAAYQTAGRIVERRGDDGSTRYVFERRYMGRPTEEAELTDDRQFYHGRRRVFYTGQTLYQEQEWDHGRPVGMWRIYDPNGVAISEIQFENHRPVWMREKFPGTAGETLTWERLTPEVQQYWQALASRPQGPNIPEPDLDTFAIDPNQADLEAEIRDP